MVIFLKAELQISWENRYKAEIFFTFFSVQTYAVSHHNRLVYLLIDKYGLLFLNYTSKISVDFTVK